MFARVADGVDDVGAVAEVIELVEREKAHARIVGFGAEDAIEFDGMADGFMNLQAKLAAFEHEVEVAFRALIRLVQRNGLFCHAGRLATRDRVRSRIRSLLAGTAHRTSSATNASGFRRPCSCTH